MKRSIIVVGILIVSVLLLLAGCARSTGQVTKCIGPYMAKGATCCLDKNENNICDEDETSRVTAVVKDRPILLYDEVCDASSRFECVEKRITPDFVWLKVRLSKDEIVQVRRMSLPELGCKGEFKQPVMKYNDVQEFTIPCVIDREVVKSKLVVQADVQNYLRYSNGQVYEVTQPRTFEFSGVISGFVLPA